MARLGCGIPANSEKERLMNKSREKRSTTLSRRPIRRFPHRERAGRVGRAAGRVVHPPEPYVKTDFMYRGRVGRVSMDFPQICLGNESLWERYAATAPTEVSKPPSLPSLPSPSAAAWGRDRRADAPCGPKIGRNGPVSAANEAVGGSSGRPGQAGRRWAKVMRVSETAIPETTDASGSDLHG